MIPLPSGIAPSPVPVDGIMSVCEMCSRACKTWLLTEDGQVCLHEPDCVAHWRAGRTSHRPKGAYARVHAR